MENISQSLTRLRLDEDIDYLVSVLLKLVENDVTLKFQLSCIAAWMLQCNPDMNVDEWDRLLTKTDKASGILWKLLKSASNFYSFEPAPLGIHLVSKLTSRTIQQSLDSVKHKPFSSSSKNVSSNLTVNMIELPSPKPNFEPIQPKISATFLYKNENQVWLRFLVNAKFSFTEIESELVQKIHPEHSANTCHLICLTATLYEFYFPFTKRASIRHTTIDTLVECIENNFNGHLIFISDLRYLYYSQSLFISNFISFYYCYHEPPQYIPNPKKYDEMEIFNNTLLQSLIFWMTDNLSIMPLETHGPLIAYSGERPSPALKKFHRKFGKNHQYIVEGTRAMQSIDESPDIGANTTYIEVINSLDLEQLPEIKNVI